MTRSTPEVFGALDSGIAVGVSGLVYRTDWLIHILFPDGRYRYDWPDQGLVADLGHDQAKYPSFWGTWREVGGAIQIERPDAKLMFAREGDALVDQDGRRFERLASPSQGELLGQWHREASASAAPAIRFDGEGRFHTEGGLLGLIADATFVADWGAAPSSLFEWPDLTGRYEMQPFSVRLVRDDGAVLDFLALAEGGRMRLGYTWFRRDA